MKILIDTSFIMTCLKEKVDFLQAEEFGQMLLPEQVIAELEKIAEYGKSKEKEIAILALQIIEKNKSKFKIIILGKKYVDSGILEYSKGEKDIAVASLDNKLKKELKGRARILTLRAKKKLALE